MKRLKKALTDLDMLPDIGVGIDYAHVRLICPSVNECPVVHLQEGVSRVVLRDVLVEGTNPLVVQRLTGECCPVVALFAKGMTKS